MTKLELTFYPDGTLEEFKKFTVWLLTHAGTTWNREQVDKVPIHKGGIKFIFEGTANEIYMLGYNWALWQFPPPKNNS